MPNLKYYIIKRGSILLPFILLVFQLSTSAAENKSGDLLHRSQLALTKVIIHDIFSPPVASRIYLYANVAAYETLVPFNKNYYSLSKSVSSLPTMEFGITNVDPEVAAVYAFFKVAGRFVFSEQQLMDSLQQILSAVNTRTKRYSNSLRLGDSVAVRIISWAMSDNYNETRKLRRYTHLKQSGKWIPTPPGYIAAIEPNWSRMRTIVLDSCNQFQPPPPPDFGKEDGSEFYRQAMEVYETGKGLTKDQENIANFWDCNPFYINTQGHLNFATKKMSPGAHWILIAGIASEKSGADLMKTSAAYVLTAIAIYDGFISCWDEKYRSNVIRPETYINSYIDEQWRPILQTPPFPEYTSGHSVISTAAAGVLSRIFGEMFPFEDVSEVDYGLPPRSFRSFRQAADEAAISRLYGGIHYMAAISNGQIQGEQIGKKVLEKIKFN